MDVILDWVPQGSVLGPLMFLIFKNKTKNERRTSQGVSIHVLNVVFIVVSLPVELCLVWMAAYIKMSIPPRLKFDILNHSLPLFYKTPRDFDS